MDYDPTTAQRNELIWLYIKENELKNLETHSQTVGQVTTEESPRKTEDSSNKEESGVSTPYLPYIVRQWAVYRWAGRN